MFQFADRVPQAAFRRFHRHIGDPRDLLDAQSRFFAQQKCLALFLRQGGDRRQQRRFLLGEFRDSIGPLVFRDLGLGQTIGVRK